MLSHICMETIQQTYAAERRDSEVKCSAKYL